MSDTALDAFYAALLEDDAEMLYERAPCGYLSTTPDGRIIKVNQTFLSLTGHERAEIVGRTFSNLLSAGSRLYHETHYAPMLHLQGRVREIALDLVAVDGSRIPVLLNSVLERNVDGVPKVIRTAVFDATERRAYERELLAAKERAERSEVRASVIARTLQRTLIPHAPPDIPGLDVAAVYRPAGAGDEIGGDFYDVFELAPDDWIVIVGDVCGKGVDAATVATVARYSTRGVALRQSQPADILASLNQVLLHEDTNRFCTAVVLRLQRHNAAWTATLSVGGHPAPLVVRGGIPEDAFGSGSPLIGAFEDVAFPTHVLTLDAGDTLLLFTDGVTEGRRDGAFYGEQRLTDAVVAAVGRPAADLADAVTSDVLSFQRERPRDDIVVVAVRVPER